MSGADIIEIPGHPGKYARRVIVDAWQAAGSPPINDAGRLKAKQQEAWDKFQAGTGSPADDPNRPDVFPLAHVRFVALDIDPTPDRVRRLSAAGLVRPYEYEPWHWQVANVYAYPLVKEIPDMALNAATDYEAFKTMLHRALKWDVRDGDKAGADAKLGMTLWDRLGAIRNAQTATPIDYDKLAAALAKQGIAGAVADELAKRLTA